MSGLPPGWIGTTLGALCDPPQYGWTTSARKEASAGLRFLRTTDISHGSLDWSSVPFCADEPPLPERYQLAPGDIVISRVGSIGLSYRLTDVVPAVFASYLIRFRPSREVDGRYLAYYLQSRAYWTQIAAASSGITLANVNAKKLAAVKLPLAPRTEQERIVAAIEEQFSRIDAGVAALEAVERRVHRMRAALLHGAVTGALTSSWRAAHPPTHVAQVPVGQSRLVQVQRAEGALPEDWQLLNLGDLIAEGPQNGLYLPASRYGRGTPILRITDFQSDRLPRRRELNLVEAGPDEAVAFALKPGDIVINRVNSMSHLGKCMVVTDELAGVLFESNMMRLRLTDAIHSEYLVLYLQSGVGRSLLLANAKQAVNQASINQKDVTGTSVVVPAPAEQQQIVSLHEAISSALTSLRNLVQVSKEHGAQLRASVLAAAFAGELTSHVEGGGPASVVLDRATGARSLSASSQSTHVRESRGGLREVPA